MNLDISGSGFRPDYPPIIPSVQPEPKPETDREKLKKEIEEAGKEVKFEKTIDEMDEQLKSVDVPLESEDESVGAPAEPQKEIGPETDDVWIMKTQIKSLEREIREKQSLLDEWEKKPEGEGSSEKDKEVFDLMKEAADANEELGYISRQYLAETPNSKFFDVVDFRNLDWNINNRTPDDWFEIFGGSEIARKLVEEKIKQFEVNQKLEQKLKDKELMESKLSDWYTDVKRLQDELSDSQIKLERLKGGETLDQLVPKREEETAEELAPAKILEPAIAPEVAIQPQVEQSHNKVEPAVKERGWVGKVADRAKAAGGGLAERLREKVEAYKQERNLPQEEIEKIEGEIADLWRKRIDLLANGKQLSEQLLKEKNRTKIREIEGLIRSNQEDLATLDAERFQLVDKIERFKVISKPTIEHKPTGPGDLFVSEKAKIYQGRQGPDQEEWKKEKILWTGTAPEEAKMPEGVPTAEVATPPSVAPVEAAGEPAVVAGPVEVEQPVEVFAEIKPEDKFIVEVKDKILNNPDVANEKDPQTKINKIAYYLSQERMARGLVIKDISDRFARFSEQSSKEYAKWDYIQAEKMLKEEGTPEVQAPVAPSEPKPEVKTEPTPKPVESAKVETKISEEDVKKELDNFLESHKDITRFEEVDRPSKAGDLLQAEAEMTGHEGIPDNFGKFYIKVPTAQDGKDTIYIDDRRDPASSRSYWFYAKEGKEFKLENLKVGKVKKLSGRDEKGNEFKLKLTIERISEPKKAVLDNEFVKAIGSYKGKKVETVQDLAQAVREELSKK